MTEFFTSLFEDFTLAGIIFNLFCSLLASFIFIILLLYFLKPQIKIVEKIAFKNIKIDGDEGQDAYLFKIINKSFFSAYEIKAQLSSYKIIQGENGIIDHHYTHIPLRNDNVPHIEAYSWFRDDGKNCIVFITYNQISKLLKNENGNIELLISAKHGLTGLTHIFKFSFTTESYVKNGKFKSGNCEDIF